MTTAHNSEISYRTACGRWARLGPYFAMFPIQFAFDVVKTHCPEGGGVLDPFAGRASSIYAAATTQRFGLGIEINPVGWLYGRAKTNPASKESVTSRIKELRDVSPSSTDEQIEELPPFYLACFSRKVLSYLVSARHHLNWRHCPIDATVMAIILVNLHGKRDQSLSNQLRQGKSMSPNYCMKWWEERDQTPPEVDPVAFLLRRVEWRYAKGIPRLSQSTLILGDSVGELPRLSRSMSDQEHRQFDLLFTSPPYFGVANYIYDQWLRLWMLGGSCLPAAADGPWMSKFASREKYRYLLESVFLSSSPLLTSDATVYVRTDARTFTFETTLDILRCTYPDKSVEIVERPLQRHSQTALFGDKRPKPGEVDIILSAR